MRNIGKNQMKHLAKINGLTLKKCQHGYEKRLRNMKSKQLMKQQIDNKIIDSYDTLINKVKQLINKIKTDKQAMDFLVSGDTRNN